MQIKSLAMIPEKSDFCPYQTSDIGTPKVLFLDIRCIYYEKETVDITNAS